ncbi:MAG TPA: hypothetical protein DDZ68_05960 [Parvularcula sp.]|nr:hypothetical protein [Parvularcula sp.]HBS33279.1 hypothetical protein [Parvularcula sp.]HBS36391.1 hypothetical protein [Parvularcula sp.]
MSDSVTLCGDHSQAETDAQLSKLARMISDARAIGCEAALKKHDHNVEYLTDARRARYLEIVALRQDEDVLEIGASMGQHSRLIAKQCRRLDAVEVVAAQAEFANLWCEQSGARNVRVLAGGATGNLPFDDASYDVVIMNYVLEWCAGRDSADPRAFHARLLADVFRVLKPGGRFFVSTKNRFGLRLLLGSVDEHLGIRFGSALPRPVARYFASRKPRAIPFGYLHSRSGLEVLLREAGFSTIEAYISFPDARRPEFIVPFDRAGAATLRALGGDGFTLKDRLFKALPFGAQKHVATSHTMIARRSV